MSAGARVAGLYAITPEVADTAHLVVMIDAALDGGATIVQYRNKAADDELRVEQARALAALCARRGASFVVNDHASLALAIDGAGLHVGRDDADDLDALRATLGPDRLLGVSCYASLDRARAAAKAGADYAAFGSMFPSPTKPAAAHAPLALFEQARPLGIALVGIGGIDATKLPSLVAAGADAAAVIHDLFSDDAPSSIRMRASALARCFPHAPSR